MGRLAVDFGVAQGAKRSADIQCDLGQASNAGQRQNQRNRRRREAEGQLAAATRRYSQREGRRLPRSLPSALLPLRATPSQYFNGLLGLGTLLYCVPRASSHV